MGVALDENLPAFNQGIYTFRAHGLIYHRIGTLLPPPGMRPRLLIREKPGTHLQYTLPTSSQVAAILVGGEELMEASDRDIIVQTVGATTNQFVEDESRVFYYAYMLQIRGITPSIILHGGRLLQQYVVDNYVKIEAQKLRWIRFHQNDIRAELYEGLQDCLNAGENNAGKCWPSNNFAIFIYWESTRYVSEISKCHGNCTKVW
ncbi:UNVERIFIED_CONTAM: hypothetical protein Sangu_2948000 [Sesamum angustifolium]|uniref:Helitron helicase-like domain-containing protein n=1 Tax=Sesamum angustifolium TaxID=2727405 RepID=A0AAW2IJZ2_9LAMI